MPQRNFRANYTAFLGSVDRKGERVKKDGWIIKRLVLRGRLKLLQC